MTAAQALPFKAFLSYSHRDKRMGDWLHRKLESFEIAAEIQGRKTDVGIVPKSLHPIFRDRVDLAASHSLTEKIRQALKDSEWLIVICSMAASKSPYVNEEIRIFKTLGRAERIVPIIVDGEPGDPERDCFPPNLRLRFDAEGRKVDGTDEPIAADARDEGDGRDMALLKVVAGLIGVRLDEIVRRDRERQRRATRKWMAVAASMVLLAVAAGGAAVMATIEWRKNARMLSLTEKFLATSLGAVTGLVTRSVESSRERGVPVKETVGFLDDAAQLFDSMSSFSSDMRRLDRPPDELLHRKALMQISYAEAYADLGESEKRIAYATEAIDHLAELVARNGDNLQFKIDWALALARRGVGLYATNRRELASRDYAAAFEKLSALKQADLGTPAQRQEIDIELAALLRRRAQIEWGLGHRADGEQAHKRSIELLKAVIAQAATPQLAERAKEEYATVLEDIVGQYRQQYPIQQIESWAIESQLIRHELLTQTPGNARRIAALSVSYITAGDVYVTANRPDVAMQAYRQSESLLRTRLQQDPGNADLNSRLAWNLIKVGDVNCLNNFDRAGCESNYREAARIFDALVERDPTNTNLRYRQAVAYNGIGIVLRADPARLDEAIAAYRTSERIYEGILRDDPQRVSVRRDLSLLQSRIGGALEAQGKTEEALDRYRKGLDVRFALHKLDPKLVLWIQDVARSYDTIAVVLFKLKRIDEAIEARLKQIEFLTLVAENNPSHAQNRLDLTKIVLLTAAALKERTQAERATALLHSSRSVMAAAREKVKDPAGWDESLARIDAALAPPAPPSVAPEPLPQATAPTPVAPAPPADEPPSRQ